ERGGRHGDDCARHTAAPDVAGRRQARGSGTGVVDGGGAWRGRGAAAERVARARRARARGAARLRGEHGPARGPARTGGAGVAPDHRRAAAVAGGARCNARTRPYTDPPARGTGGGPGPRGAAHSGASAQRAGAAGPSVARSAECTFVVVAVAAGREP